MQFRNALAVAIYDLLNGDSDLGDEVNGVYAEAMPGTVSSPYVTIYAPLTDGNSVYVLDGGSSHVKYPTIQVNAWYDGDTPTPKLKTIGDFVDAALDGTEVDDDTLGKFQLQALPGFGDFDFVDNLWRWFNRYKCVAIIS